MHPQRIRLILLQLLGGGAVLGSYAWSFIGHSAAMAALWGGVPESARTLYTINMFLAAAGYFCFAPYITFRLDPDTTRIAGRFGFGLFPLCFALVLLPSALWLPMTSAVIRSPDSVLWWAIRIDLALVAIGSLGLATALGGLAFAPRGRLLAAIGLAPFCLQTVVLDALVWPTYFTLGVE